MKHELPSFAVLIDAKNIRLDNAIKKDSQSERVKAVTQASAANGWAPISTIGQKLKALGRDIKESGRPTLTEALKATSLFEMQGKGAARYFRVRA